MGPMVDGNDHSEVNTRCHSDWVGLKWVKTESNDKMIFRQKKTWMILKGISLSTILTSQVLDVVLFIHRDVSFFEKTFNVSFFLCFNRFLFLVSLLFHVWNKNKQPYMFFFPVAGSLGFFQTSGSGSHHGFHHLDCPDQTLMPWIWTRLLKICCWRKRRRRVSRVSAFRGPEMRWWDSDGDLEPFFFVGRYIFFGTMDSL